MITTKSTLELCNIHKDYEGSTLLKGINLRVAGGETLCLLGRSGSGKSTLLRIIAGLEKPESGDVLWNGENILTVPVWQRRFGLMFQDYALFPHRSVEENVAFGLRMQGADRLRVQQRVSEVLELVNMTGFSRRCVTDLSGGEQQRIALARALAPEPRLLMLDEPLAALDRALRSELQGELRVLLHKAGIPVIYVTHDQEEAFSLGDRVAILADGVIEQEGTPEEIYQHPKNRKVAEFLGMTNFIEGVVISENPLIVETSAGRFQKGEQVNSFKTGDPVTVLLRLDGAVIANGSEGTNILSGRVLNCVFHGDSFKVNISYPAGQELVFNLSDPVSVGQELHLSIQDKSILFFYF